MKFLLVVLFLSVTTVAHAQTFPIVVHGSPQCARYVSDDTPIDPGVTCHTPANVSLQTHWGPGNPTTCTPSLGLLDPCVAHAPHVELLHAPIYGEMHGAFTLNGQLILHLTAGTVTGFDSPVLRSVTWNGATTFTGNPTGDVTIPFQAVIDPAVGFANGYWEAPYGFSPHGWTFVRFRVHLQFDNGDVNDAFADFPFFSMYDPTAPELASAFGIHLGMSSQPSSLRDPGGFGMFGQDIIEVREMLPLLGPLMKPWPLPTLNGYPYAESPLLPQGETFARVDMNLHIGDLGRPLTVGVLDPAEIGAGTHRIALGWRTTTGAGNAAFAPNETVVELAVFTVTVGTAPPPPQPSPWKVLFTQPSPFIWLAQCIDATLTQCSPLNALAVCAGTTPTTCAGTSVVVP